MKQTKYLIVISFFIFLASCSDKKAGQENNLSTAISSSSATDEIIIKPQMSADTLKGSLKAFASGTLHGGASNIFYYSPAVRRRIIWGGLVPFDQVWVTGAHMATRLELETSVKINDVILPAGNYAVFTIPNNESWTFIINKNHQQHLSDDYDSKDDLVRVQVAPESTTHQERLRYTLENNVITVHWEKIRISIVTEPAGE